MGSVVRAFPRSAFRRLRWPLLAATYRIIERVRDLRLLPFDVEDLSGAEQHRRDFIEILDLIVEFRFIRVEQLNARLETAVQLLRAVLDIRCAAQDSSQLDLPMMFPWMKGRTWRSTSRSRSATGRDECLGTASGT